MTTLQHFTIIVKLIVKIYIVYQFSINVSRIIFMAFTHRITFLNKLSYISVPLFSTLIFQIDTYTYLVYCTEHTSVYLKIRIFTSSAIVFNIVKISHILKHEWQTSKVSR